MLGFDCITFDPNVMGGRACIRGMRVRVSLIVNLIANGMTVENIIEAHPYFESRARSRFGYRQTVGDFSKTSDRYASSSAIPM
jgi:hypothetical protein